MKKVSKIKLAKSYAEALFEVSREKDAEKQVFEDMIKLMEIVASDQDIVKYLANPTWSLVSKKAAIAEIAKKVKIGETSLNCLDVIAENSHFNFLYDILEQFENLYYQKNDVVKIDVKTAIELTKSQDEKLKDNLKKLLNKKIVIKYEIKPEILGGLLLQFGSKIIDDSIKGKLDHIELLMKGAK